MVSKTLIDGNKVKAAFLEETQRDIAQLKKKTGNVPGLAVILVGDNPASQAYVGMKKKACEKIGIASFEFLLKEEDGPQALHELIISLNDRDDIHGILLQLPLPEGYDESSFLSLISPRKDVDGFHPENVGKLLLGLETFQSCTPLGICELLKYYDLDPTGKHVVIVGRSNIVGKPLAAMLMQKAPFRNATVTVCHSQSKQMDALCLKADILIAAIGSPLFIRADMVKEGAIVIDVGINKVDDTDSARGYRLVGDVDFDAVSSKAAAITPVPGGVGPLTIAMLMRNTVLAFKRIQD